MAQRTVPKLSLVLLLFSCTRGESWIKAFETLDNGDSLSSCTRTDCETRGGTCDSTGSPLRTCTPPYVCVHTGSTQKGKCSAALALGTACSEDAECNTGDLTIYNRYCSTNGVCMTYSKEGEACDNASLCDVGLSCKSGYCQLATSAQGQSCTNSTCEPGLFCHPKTLICTTFLSSGENCSGGLSCDVGDSCLDGLCIDHYTLGEGKTCKTKSCAPPLVCSNSGLCVQKGSVKRRSCTLVDDCNSDVADCVCDSASGNQICAAKVAPSAKAVLLYKEVVACIKENDYDERPCFPKTLQWFAEKLSSRMIVSVPELYCMLGTSSSLEAVPALLFFVGIAAALMN